MTVVNMTTTVANRRHESTGGGRVRDSNHEALPERRLTAYEKLSLDLSSDQKLLKEITLGKRIGFYRIRGELGTGNFSQVKLGIHVLTKGRSVRLTKNNRVPIAPPSSSFAASRLSYNILDFLSDSTLFNLS